VKGDGQRCKLTLRQDDRWDGVVYPAHLDSKKGDWAVAMVSFARFVPTRHGRILTGMPEAQAEGLRSVGLLISDKQDGPFRLEIDWVKAYTGD
jgi:hypothetical protein